jgi:hypothetical protein
MIRIASAAVLAALLFPTARAAAEGPGKDKKLIEWGWDEPDTGFLRQNVAKMEQLPFDGLVFHADSSQGGSLAWEMWGSRKFQPAEFQQAVADLNSTPFHRLTERFLRVNVTPGSVDWFDDRAWRVVIHNFGVAADVAKQGRCRGMMFDVEQYNSQLFDYRKLPHGAGRSFADYRAKVCQRGREWMKAVNAPFPDITVLLTFAYSVTGGRPRDRAGASYGLLGDFLDGMLAEAAPQTTIVDAWEGAYTYKTKEQFRQAYDAIKVKLAPLAGDPRQYRRRIQAGFGIWMDCNWRTAGWHTDDLSKNFFTPAAFEDSVRLALQAADRYVWIYTEQPLWWTNQRLPPAYVQALRDARRPAEAPR